jgi:hypothetical protein
LTAPPRAAMLGGVATYRPAVGIAVVCMGAISVGCVGLGAGCHRPGYHPHGWHGFFRRGGNR